MSEMVFIYILFFAVIVLAGVCGIMAKKIDELTVELNQIDTWIANLSLVLDRTKELAETNGIEIKNFSADIERIKVAIADHAEQNKTENDLLLKNIEDMSKKIEELPIDEFIETQKQEAAYMQGMQNIFNYGGEVQRLNVEALKHE